MQCMREVEFTRSQLWLVQGLMQLEADGRLTAEIAPFGRELAVKLLEQLWHAEREGLERVGVSLSPEEALRLAVALKPTMRDEKGLGVKDLIFALLNAFYEPEPDDWVRLREVFPG